MGMSGQFTSRNMTWRSNQGCITFKRSILIWFYWMFYDHFSALSLFAKLGRWGWWWGWLEQKTLDTSKRLHQNKTQSTGSVDKGLTELDPNLLPSLGLQTQKSAGASSLRVPTGVWNVLAGGRQQPGLKLWSPPPPPRSKEVFKVFEPKLVDILLYAMIEFFNHGTQGGASCPLSPTLLLDLRREAGYTFAPFGGS